MHKYFIKTPWFVKKFFPSYVWSMPAEENAVYLTFDDGPHPEITTWVLDELKKYNAEATFFCIGKNVEQFPEIFQRIIDEGHATGNHTYTHMNGWKCDDKKYLEDVAEGAAIVRTNLFRPPYGRIKNSQAKRIASVSKMDEVKIIMWDVLSADFDTDCSEEECLSNVLKNISPGSIIVFHDSEKAFKNLKYVLPVVLEYSREMKMALKKIEFDGWGRL